jgi:hypothetical protein
MNVDPSLVTPDLFVRGTQTQSIPTSVNIERLSSESPLDHFRFCFALLNEARRLKDAPQIVRSYEMALADLTGRNYQPSIAALALTAHYLGKPHENIAPQLFSSKAPIGWIGGGRQGDRLLPVPIAWRLAGMWEELGRLENNMALIQSSIDARSWLISIASMAPDLFCRESHFVETAVNGCRAIEKKLENTFGQDAALGIARWSCASQDACLTLSGWNTGLGSLRFRSVEIPSFGPHRFPLSDLDGFGIAQIGAHRAEIEAGTDSLCIKGWTRCFAARDIWLSLQAAVGSGCASMDVRWVGIEPNTPGLCFMAFYVKAASCLLEDATHVRPRSMQKYVGKSQKIVFDQIVQFECSEILNMHVIPLAGSGCFWNASFLIAFEFTSSQNQAYYSIRFL